MKIKPKNLIIPLFSFLVACLSWFAYYQTIQDIEEIRQGSKALKESISANKAKNEELSLLKKNIRSTLSDRDELISVFIPHEDIPDFLQSIENMGKSSGVSVSTKTVSTATLAELESVKKETAIVALDALGNWRDSMQFLFLLEALPYKSAINTFSIEQSDNTPGDSKAQASTTTIKRGWKSSIKLNVVKLKEKND